MSRLILKSSLPLLSLVLLAATPAHAQPQVETSRSNPAPAAAVAEGADKQGNVTFRNDAYITLTGTVGNIIDDDEFQLNHAGGVITVDTNDSWPDLFRKDAPTLLKTGDRVTVTGKVDNNLFSTNEIEAYRLEVSGEQFSRVYTDERYAPGSKDDYAAYHNVTYGAGLEDDQKVRLAGEVARILDDDAFLLRYGNGEIRVDIDDVEFSDANRLMVGDEVIVFGEVDKDWFSKKEVEADRVILSRAYSQSRQ